MRFLLLTAALSLSACDAAYNSPFVCTEHFVTIQVEVVDDFGRAVTGLSHESVNERTGEVLVSGDPDPTIGESGHYPVASDAHAAMVRVDGDPVVFTATGDGVRASARYVIADDGCHVRKEDGPDQITVEVL